MIKLLDADDLDYVITVVNTRSDARDPLVLPPETRDRLASCLTYAYRDYAGWQLPQIERSAAMMYWSIIGTMPLPDGNKRVATVATALFLLQNGYLPTWDPEKLYKVATLHGTDDAAAERALEDLALLIFSSIRPLEEQDIYSAAIPGAT